MDRRIEAHSVEVICLPRMLGCDTRMRFENVSLIANQSLFHYNILVNCK